MRRWITTLLVQFSIFATMDRSLYVSFTCLALSLMVFVFVVVQQTKEPNDENSLAFNEMRQSLDGLSNNMDGLRGRIDGVQDKVNDFKEKIEDTKETVVSQEMAYDDLEDKLDKLKNDPEILKKGFENLRGNQSDVQVMKPTSSGKTFHLGLEEATWDEAKTKCESMDMKLVAIESREDQETVVALIKQTVSDMTRKNFWTSGCDRYTLNYEWSTIRRSMVYSNWQKGEPNDEYFSQYRETEDCVSMDVDFDYRWNDNICSQRNYFVCEKKN